MAHNRPNFPPAWLWTPGYLGVGIEQLYEDYPDSHLDEVVNSEEAIRIPWLYDRDRDPNSFPNSVDQEGQSIANQIHTQSERDQLSHQEQLIANHMEIQEPPGLELRMNERSIENRMPIQQPSESEQLTDQDQSIPNQMNIQQPSESEQLFDQEQLIANWMMTQQPLVRKQFLAQVHTMANCLQIQRATECNRLVNQGSISIQQPSVRKQFLDNIQSIAKQIQTQQRSENNQLVNQMPMQQPLGHELVLQHVQSIANRMQIELPPGRKQLVNQRSIANRTQYPLPSGTEELVNQEFIANQMRPLPSQLEQLVNQEFIANQMRPLPSGIEELANQEFIANQMRPLPSGFEQLVYPGQFIGNGMNYQQMSGQEQLRNPGQFIGNGMNHQQMLGREQLRNPGQFIGNGMNHQQMLGQEQLRNPGQFIGNGMNHQQASGREQLGNPGQFICNGMNHQQASGREQLQRRCLEPRQSREEPRLNLGYDYLGYDHEAALRDAEARCERAMPAAPPRNAFQSELLYGQPFHQYQLFEDSPLLKCQKSREAFQNQPNFSYFSYPYVPSVKIPPAATVTSADSDYARNMAGSASAAQGARDMSNIPLPLHVVSRHETPRDQIPMYKASERLARAKKHHPQRSSQFNAASIVMDDRSYSIVAGMASRSIDRQASFLPNNCAAIQMGQPSQMDSPDTIMGSITFNQGRKLTQAEKKRVERFRAQSNYQ